MAERMECPAVFNGEPFSVTLSKELKDVAFISGPIDTGPDESYFRSHYVPMIEAAIANDHDFVIGPIPHGVDADALNYLLARSVRPKKITIFVTPSENAWWGKNFRALGVNVHVIDGQMTSERDTALTKASTYDILRVRTEKEARDFYGKLYRKGHVTNTERNWKRRRGISEYEIVSIEEMNRTMGFE